MITTKMFSVEFEYNTGALWRIAFGGTFTDRVDVKANDEEDARAKAWNEIRKAHGSKVATILNVVAV